MKFSKRRVLILLQNRPIEDDPRVRREALTLMEAGFEVCVICPRIKNNDVVENKALANGVRVFSYASLAPSLGIVSYLLEYSYSWISTFVLSLRVLINPGFDVIHACNPPDTFFLIGMIHKILGKRFIFDQHDLCPELYLSRFSRPSRIVYKVLLLLEKLTYKTADVVIATNDSYKRIALTRGEVATKQVFVVRNGPIEIQEDVEPDPSFKRNHRFLVLYMGEISPQDGVDYLVKAASQLIRKGRNDIYFLVVGSGASLGGLRRMIRNLRLDQHFGFTGWISDYKLLWKLLSTADVCVAPEPQNPLNDHSTFIKVMDYMAAGRPVVAYDLAETHITAKEAAIYAVPNSVEDFACKIEELLEDEERRRNMGEYGRRRIKEALSWGHSKKSLLKAYEYIQKDRK